MNLPNVFRRSVISTCSRCSQNQRILHKYQTYSRYSTHVKSKLAANGPGLAEFINKTSIYQNDVPTQHPYLQPQEYSASNSQKGSTILNTSSVHC